jgi:glycosyltransferase involved in cell wall biosynthesis
VIVRSVSVVLCTYNRAALLGETLEAMQAMEAVPDCEAEIIVVDNNSSDDTAATVERVARTARIPILYLHEQRQGKSFALNHALTRARGDVLALTDDDVLPAADWLARIVANFREQQLTFVFGKVRPRWGVKPPPELLTQRAQDIWGPLAILDYGDKPELYTADNVWQRLPIGANLAFARSALVAIGGWRTDLGKVNNTLISGEDHEIFIRLRRYGLYAGRYDPGVMVRHYVPPNRLTRRYFRRWYFWHGKTQALMLDDLFPGVELNQTPRLAGVPHFLYRQGLVQFVKWLKCLGSQDGLGLLVEELGVLRFAGLYFQCWRRYFGGAPPKVAERAPESVPPVFSP